MHTKTICQIETIGIVVYYVDRILHLLKHLGGVVELTGGLSQTALYVNVYIYILYGA